MVGSPLFRERYLSSRLILAVVLVLTGGVHGVEAGDPVPDVDVILEQEVPPRHAGARQQDGTPPSRDSKALCDPVLGTSCGWPGLRVRVGEAFEGDEIELVLAGRLVDNARVDWAPAGWRVVVERDGDEGLVRLFRCEAGDGGSTGIGQRARRLLLDDLEDGSVTGDDLGRMASGLRRCQDARADRATKDVGHLRAPGRHRQPRAMSPVFE